jgi:chemotaxis protein MotB
MPKKKQPDEIPVPGWVVTYGDMMSLLLTFFVLLLSFSTISEKDFQEAMASVRFALGPFARMNSVLSTSPRIPRRAKTETEQAARRLRRMLQVRGIERQMKIEYDARGGLKISLPSAILFDSGNAVLRPESYPLLQNIAEVLAQLPDTFIEVRGHTDARPLAEGGSFRDNYELSYFRADSVARQLTAPGGVPLEQFEIIACGPSQPKATNATEEGRIANRRVEIFVRGLVDASTIESLEDAPGGQSDEPIFDPLSPREFNELR